MTFVHNKFLNVSDVKTDGLQSPCIRVVKALLGVSLTSARIPWNNKGHIIVTSQ